MLRKAEKSSLSFGREGYDSFRTRFLSHLANENTHLVHGFLISHTISFENWKIGYRELSFSSSKTS